MKKTITIRDVAREAGVSHQTVSRAFNDKAEISPETKQRVLTVAREMGYRPSGLARSLSTNRTHTVGFIVPDITSVFFSLIAKGAESVTAQKGYSFFLVNTYRDILHQTKALETLWDNRADGIILYASFPPEQELREYVERLQHIVFINGQSVPMIEGKTAAINVDDYAGANLAVSHLLTGGHRKIAYLTVSVPSRSGKQRLAGYRHAFSQRGMPVDEDLIYECIPVTPEGYATTVRLLREHPDVTAILAYNDVTAMGVMQACQDMGRKIPDDIAVMGFDDIPLASMLRPSLTTIRIGMEDLGILAMQTLLSMIEDQNDKLAVEHIVTPQLVIRDSAP